MDEKLPSYRVNDLDTLRSSHVRALEEIVKERVIYFSGVDEEFVRIRQAHATVSKQINAAIRAYRDYKDSINADEFELAAYAQNYLLEKRTELLFRQNQIGRTAKRIEDIVTDFGFEKRTITPPEENSIDYVIYTRERDGHVDVLADRDLRKRKTELQLYRVLESEFDDWYDALRMGVESVLDSAKRVRGERIGAIIGTIVGGGTYLAAIAAYVFFLSDDIPTLLAPMAAALTLGLMQGGAYLGSKTSYFSGKLIAKGSKALLHKSIQEQFAPKYRVPEEHIADSKSPMEEEHARLKDELDDYIIMSAALIPPDNANL